MLAVRRFMQDLADQLAARAAAGVPLSVEETADVASALREWVAEIDRGAAPPLQHALREAVRGRLRVIPGGLA